VIQYFFFSKIRLIIEEIIFFIYTAQWKSIHAGRGEPGGCPRYPGTPLGQKMFGWGYWAKKYSQGPKIFSVGGHPP